VLNWFDGPTALSFQEVDRNMDVAVNQPIFEITERRTFAHHVLHPRSVIIGTRNGMGGGNGDYTIREFDRAEQARWTTYKLHATDDEWIDYLKGVRLDIGSLPLWVTRPYTNDTTLSDTLIPNFLDQNKSLISYATYVPNVVSPNRRSWQWLGLALQNSGLSKQPKKYACEIALVSSDIVGQNASAALFQYCQSLETAISAEDILCGCGEAFAEMANIGAAELIDLGNRLTQHKEFATAIQDDRMVNVAEFLVRLPAEIFRRLTDTSDPTLLSIYLTGCKEIAHFSGPLLTFQYIACDSAELSKTEETAIASRAEWLQRRETLRLTSAPKGVTTKVRASKKAKQS
jgi:hypothetical protein